MFPDEGADVSNVYNSVKGNGNSYKDLLGLSGDLSSLALAILQYENGNSCVNDGNPVNENYIVTSDLGTLNVYNWINWGEFTGSVTEHAIYTADAPIIVNYLTGDLGINYNKDWISKKYNVTELIN